MTLGPPGFLLLLGAPLLAGVLIVRAVGLRWRDDRAAFAAWSWIVGTLAIAVTLFGAAVINCPLRGWVAGAIAVGGAGLAAGVSRGARAERGATEGRGRIRVLGSIVVFVAVLSLIDLTIVGLSRPVVEADECHIWAAKAKALFHAGGFNAGFRDLTDARFFVMARLPLPVEHADYPAFPALLHLWTFDVAGRVVHLENRLPIAAFGVAFLLLASSALRRAGGALAGTLVFAALALTTYAVRGFVAAHADGIVACAALAMVDAWQRWRERGERRWFALSCLAAGLLLWTKHEGVLIFVSFVAAVFWRWITSRRQGSGAAPRLRPGRAMAWLVFPVACLAATWIVNVVFDLKNDLAGANAEARPFWARAFGAATDRGAEVLRRIGQDVILGGAASRGIFAIFGVFSVLAWRRMFRGPEAVAALTTLFAAAGYWFVFTGSHQPLDWHWETAGVRVFSQILPIAAVAIAPVLRDGLTVTPPEWAREPRSPEASTPLPR